MRLLLEQVLLAHEPALRLSVFLGLLFLFAVSEALSPARQRTAPRRLRWPSHLVLATLNTLALRLFGPVLAVGVAVWASIQGIGLLNWLDAPAAVAWLVSLLILDAAIWLQHFAVHKIALLWRFHRIHHADTDVDTTTALRFHPVEIVLSMGYKIVIVAAIGAPAGAIILFEIGLNGMAMFNHANLALPKPVDRILRALIVTPDMHRIHHSTRRAEHDSNYGFNLSIWDRAFGTYTADAEDGPDRFRIGLDGLHDPAKVAGLGFLLTDPFRKRQDKTPRSAPVSGHTR